MSFFKNLLFPKRPRVFLLVRQGKRGIETYIDDKAIEEFSVPIAVQTMTFLEVAVAQLREKFIPQEDGNDDTKDKTSR